jgi:pSer/pThr/pTyr-binding forkhead associated (FHA) protein
MCLIVEAGPLSGHKYFVKTDSPILIGRSEEANVRIAYDEFCSRRHAKVFWENESCYIQDLNSTNGTAVNDHQITEKIKLNDGDIVSFGSTRLVVASIEQKKKNKSDVSDDVQYDD